jgi:glutamyl-tRNA reductase
MLSQALELGIDGLITTSTRNRTELHGFAKHPFNQTSFVIITVDR